MRKIILSCLVLTTISFFSAAQDSLQTTTLREVVVSATRTEQPVIETPRSVSVIHQDVIRNSAYQSLGELLNAQSGLYVVGANQTPGTNQNIFMRGANSNQVAVLVDGVRITDPSSPNAAIDLSEISLANVERVEVIRGSHSTMYGGAAIGGVINLITKKDSREGLHGDVSWQGGYFGKGAWSTTENVNLVYTNPSGIYVNGSIFRQDVNGLDATEKSESNDSFTADRDGFEKTDASLKAGFRNARWDANIAFKKSHQYTEVDNGAFSDDDNYYLLFDRNLFQYQAAYQLTPLMEVSLLGSFSHNKRFYENDSSRIAAGMWDKSYSTGTYSGNLQTHEIQFNFEKNDLNFVLGAGLYGEKMAFDNYFFYNDPSFPLEVVTDYDSIDTRTSTRYVFTQAGYRWGRFNFSAGARMSHHSLAGNFVTVGINPSFTYHDLLLFGSVSTGFNAPSLYQLYDPTRGFTAHTTRGNRTLDPERSLSLEAGVKKEFSSGSFLTFSAFHTTVRESIEFVYLWEGSTPLDGLTYADDRGDTYINIAEQRAYGIELEGHLRMSEKISLRGNISALRTRVQADPEDLDAGHTGEHHIQLYNLGTFLHSSVSQKQMVRRPDVTAFTAVTYRPVRALAANASYRYTGKRFDSGFDGSLGPYGGLGRISVQPYHLVDVSLDWKASDILNLGCKVENVLDDVYREVAGFRTRGRSFYLKVTARW